MADEREPSEPHAIVVGGGFAGVACAKRLGRRGVATTLIDKNTYHQYQPLLYQVATAQLAPDDVMQPLREIFRKHPAVTVKRGEVSEVDAATRTVTTAEGQRYSGTHLVLAMGSTPNFFGVPGAAEHAFPLYSANDAERLRNRILQAFEDADAEPARIGRGALNFVIVGGGATGVETAGALGDLVNDALPQRFADLDVARSRVILVDHGHALLAPFSETAHDYAAKVLRHKRVELLMGRSVTEVHHDRVVFGDGTEIPTRCVVWAGGLRAARIDGLDQLSTGRGGRIDAGQDLAVDGAPQVYAVGDMSSVTGPDGAPYPQLGSVALQQGSAVADSILADIAGERTPSFRYHDKGIMAMIGRRAAIAEIGSHRHELHGTVAFAAWLGVHAWLLGSTRERVNAFMNWAWDVFSLNREPAVIDAPDAARIDWDDDDGPS